MKINKKNIFLLIFNIAFFWLIMNIGVNAVIATKEVAALEVHKKTDINKIKKLELEKEVLKKKVKSLKNKELIEKIARERLNMKKPGEEIYKLVK